MTFLPVNVRDVIEVLLPERYSRWIGKRYAKPSEAVDAIQERLRPFFESHQFRRQNRCFCRKTDGGITQVIAFQIGQWGLWGDGYGRFTINAGVFIPEVREVLIGQKPTRHISDEKCVKRQRIGLLAPGGKDIWWPARDHSAISKDIEQRMREQALPYLAQLDTLERCLRVHPVHEPMEQVINAIILNSLGRRSEAHELLNDAISDAESRKMMDYVEDIRQISKRLGLS